MKEKGILTVEPWQKLLNKRHKAIYIVKHIDKGSVVLVSEDGSKTLRVLADFISPDEYEQLED